MSDPEHELSEDATRLAEGEPTSLNQVIEQLASAAQLRNEVDGGFGGNNLVQCENVLMPKSSMMMQLAGEKRKRR